MPKQNKPRSIGFIIKHRQPEAAALAIELAQFVMNSGKNVAVYFADESTPVAERFRALLKRPDRSRAKIVKKTKLVDLCDFIVVLGGDGTYLSIARLMKSRSVPVMGINMGQLGFLTEIKRSEARETLSLILRGEEPVISERVLLEVTLERQGKVIFQGPVVNDAVVSKGAIARIIGLDVSVNGRWAQSIRADGVIVSTPTGSTAYSLAAGGPIIEPSLPALVVTAICPHSLTQRPLVISDTSTIQILLKQRPGHVLMTLDGQDAVDLKEGDLVTIKRFKKHSLKLISSPTRDYFGLLREKLRFGERA
jgi:NAD+ kinase